MAEFNIRFFFFLDFIRIEEFAKEEMDLTLATNLDFEMPLADLSDVKSMMDSINIVPGSIDILVLQFHNC